MLERRGRSCQRDQERQVGRSCSTCTRPVDERDKAVVHAAAPSRVHHARGARHGEWARWSEAWQATRCASTTASASTRIKFVTDGVLVRELMADPLLSRYWSSWSTRHERSSTRPAAGPLAQDPAAPRLRIIVSSATLDAEAFEASTAPDGDGDGDSDGSIGGRPGILSVQGASIPSMCSTRSTPSATACRAVETALELHQTQPPGDILIF